MARTAHEYWLLSFLSVSGLACGQAETSVPSSPADTTAAATSADDAAAPASGDASGVGCPPPEGTNLPSCPGPVWGRDVATGACCEYPTSCVVPQVMPRFYSLEECQTDCRCGRLDRRLDEGQLYPYSATEWTTLECRCQGGDCPGDLSTTIQRWCDSSGAPESTRLEGCGMVALQFEGGYTGATNVFDAVSGALIGLSSYSDIRSDPCWVFDVVAGREFDCADFTQCRLCAQSSSSTVTLPECE